MTTRVTRSNKSTPVHTTTTPQQSQQNVTDYFSSVVSSLSKKKGFLSATKNLSAALSEDSISIDKAKILLANKEVLSSTAAITDQGAPVIRGNSAKVKVCSDNKKAKSKQVTSVATRKTRNVITKATTQSAKMIDFGPKVGRLDFGETSYTYSNESFQVSPPKKARVGPKGPTASTVETTDPLTFVVTTAVESQQSSIATETTSTKQQTLNVAEIKEKLKGCKNLANLKQHLASINGCADKVKQFKAMKVPVLSPRKIQSPVKLRGKGLSTPSKPLSSPYLAKCLDSPRAKVFCYSL